MKKILTLVLCAIALCGCTRQNFSEMEEGRVNLELSSRSGALHTQAVRTADSPMVENVTVGVYAAPKDGGPSAAGDGFANVRFVSDGNGALGKGSVSLLIGESYDVYGYSPYVLGTVNADAIPFSHGDDVLWSEKATIEKVSSTNHSAQLAFSHKVAQVAFTVTVDPSFSGSQTITDDSSIEVTGFYPSAALHVGAGVVTVTSEVGAKITAAGKDGVLKTDATCFFVPKESSMTLTIRIIHAAIPMTTQITRTFVAGESYRYNVKIVDAQLGITATVVDWVPIDPEDIQIQK